MNPDPLPASGKPLKAVRYNGHDTDPKDRDDKDEYNDPSSVVNNGQDIEYQQNKFHIDLKDMNLPYDPSKSGWYKIRVILDDDLENFEFYDGANAIRTPEGDFNNTLICQKKSNEHPNDVTGHKKNRRVFTFFVKRREANVIPLNIALVAKSGYVGYATPIIIDPKIKNDG